MHVAILSSIDRVQAVPQIHQGGTTTDRHSLRSSPALLGSRPVLPDAARPDDDVTQRAVVDYLHGTL